MGLRRDESAISAVVGAVLLLALFASAMTVYVVQTLPDWKADKEHNQQLRVQGELSGLRSDLDALAARRDAGPVTATIPLETPRVPLLQSVPARATLGLENDFSATFDFPAAIVYLDDGAAVATPGATSPCAGPCIEAFDGLVLGVSMANAASGLLATATFTDSATPTAGTLTVSLQHFDTNDAGRSCDGEVRLTVTSGPQTFATPLLCSNSNTVSLGGGSAPYRIDLLDARLGVTSLLGRLTPPLALALVEENADVTLSTALVYEDTSGVTQVTGTGVAQASPVGGIDGGRLVYLPRYSSFPNQQLSLEGGAIVASSGGTRQALVGDAPLDFSVSGGLGSLTWTLTDLQGAGTVGGGREATVSAGFDRVEDVVFTLPAACPLASPCGTITLTTPSAVAWGSFFTLQAGLAGASDSVAVTTDTVAGTVTLELGSDAALAVTQGWVVQLRVVHATLDIS